MVLIIRPAQYNPDVHKLFDVIKIGIMTTDVIMKDYIPPSLYGLTVFIDLDGVTWRYLKQVNPRLAMNIVHAWQSCYPLRLRSINFINAPTYIHIGLAIFKPFMSEKLKRRFHVYKCDETMIPKCLENIPVNIRPFEYGGTDGTVQEIIGCMKELVERNHDWYIDDDKYKIISKQSK